MEYKKLHNGISNSVDAMYNIFARREQKIMQCAQRIIFCSYFRHNDENGQTHGFQARAGAFPSCILYLMQTKGDGL